MNKDDKSWLEEIRQIPGNHGYFITESGKVISNRSRFGDGLHELKGWNNKKGYHVVGIMQENGRVKNVPVHKLQELAFLGGPKEGLQIDHIDGDKTNNHVSNLRQVTPYENAHNPVTLERNRKVLASKEYRDRLKSIMQEKFKDPEFRQRVADAAHKRLNDPKWQRNHASAMKEVWSRPQMQKQIYENLEKMNNDPEMRAYNAQRSREVNSRKCTATRNDGTTITFNSVTECANHFGLNPGTITRYMHDKIQNSSGWSFSRNDKETK